MTNTANWLPGVCLICITGAGASFAQERIASDGFRRHFFEKPQRIEQDWYALDSGSNAIKFERLKSRPTVVVLFRGHGCYHCVQQLTELEKIESRFRSRGVRLVAISDEAVETMKTALKSRVLPFEVFTDPKSRLAEKMGRSSIENWHGVLVLDQSGAVKWRITGRKPLMDFREVFDVIDRMELPRSSLDSHLLEKR